ncbi:MAG: FdtA/QdtA family cupin domain-containing protein [Bacteroidetes bacterium]|nr:FdtA/QdtA family cupin domain-containing protein [Bacteroidota bacterium]MDA0860136.1 FdtA/QdtA family cupin domain-containing protein [Bacteroidota bacterium]MDA1318233.1 FdtA/QdtA family cupin domain-containing protein [Bacteroidota bacterium]
MSKIINIPKITDTRGNLGVLEKETVPFDIKRVYYLFDVPSSAYRGGHAHIDQLELLVALSGSFDVKLHDGKSETLVRLNKPDKGLLIEKGVWRELDNFSSGAVCLVLASDEFDETDYIRDFETFKIRYS